MSSLFDLIYSQPVSQVADEHPSNATPFQVTSVLKPFSHFQDSVTASKTARKLLSVQFEDQTKHHPRSLLHELETFSSSDNHTDEREDDDKSNTDEEHVSNMPINKLSKLKKRYGIRKVFIDPF